MIVIKKMESQYSLFSPTIVVNKKLGSIDESKQYGLFPHKVVMYKTVDIRDVSQNGLYLKFVRDDFKDYNTCLAAVEQNGLAIKHVPQRIRSAEMYTTAAKQNGAAIKYVPKKLITPELGLDAVSQNFLSLFAIPKQMRTYEVYCEAIRQNGLIAEFVPHSMRKGELDVVDVIDPNQDSYIWKSYKIFS